MAGALDRITEDEQDREAHEHLVAECPWYRAVHGSLNAADPDEHCTALKPAKPAGGGVPRLVAKLAADEVTLTPRTPEASTVVKPTVPPGGPGLFHVKGMHLPPYMEHLWFHLVKRYGKHDAYRVANGIVHKWAEGINPGGWKRKGGGSAHVHADVQAAAAKNIAEWEADRARAHSHVRATAGPDLTKSEAGYRKADTPEKRCGTCSMSSWGTGSTGTCSLVQGTIEKTHVCDHWEAEAKLSGAVNMGTVSSPSQRGFQSASSMAGKYSQYGLHQHPSQTVSPSPPLPPDVPLPTPAEVRALISKVPDATDISLSNSVKVFLETAAVKLEKDDQQHALFALRSAQASVYSAYKSDLGTYAASTLNAPGALSTTDARVVPAAQSSATSAMLQGRDRQMVWRHLATDVAAMITRVRKKYFHGHINGVSPNLRLAEESSMTALGKVAAFSGADITTGNDVSFPTETDTSLETKLISPPDAIQVSDFKAARELASLPPLSRIAIDAHLNSARNALRSKHYMAASQFLGQAIAAAKAVSAYHLAKDLHRQLEALAEYGNRQHSEKDMSYRPLNQNSPQTTADTGNRKLSARLR